MSFSYSSGTIIQQNESPVNITGVAAITGGLRFTTATPHGYSNGDFIQIKGTTDYNYAWRLEGLSSNTFDVTYQRDKYGNRLSFTSSQTGTCERGDRNIAGIVGLPGVTTMVSGGMTIVNVGSNVLDIRGALLMDGRNYQLVSNQGTKGIYVNGYGFLKLGRTINEGDEMFSHVTHVYLNTGVPTNLYDPGILDTPSGALCVDGANATLHWEYSSIQCMTFGSGTAGNGFNFINNANIFIQEGIWQTRQPYLSGWRTPNGRVLGNFYFYGSTITFSSVVAGNEPKGLNIVNASSALFGQGAAKFEWEDLNIANQGNVADLKVWTDVSVPFTEQYAINNSTGNNLKIKSDTPSPDARNKGRNLVIKQVVPRVKDGNGDTVDGGYVFIKDNDNGHRKNLNGFDDTVDFTYVTPISNGVGNQLDVITAIVNVASTTSTPPAASNVARGTSNTAEYRVDFRGKGDTDLPAADDPVTQEAYDETAKFDALYVRYGYYPAPIESLLSGNGVLNLGLTSFENPYITLSRAEAAAITGISISGDTITVTEDHSISEIFHYVQLYEESHYEEVWDNSFISIFSTSDGSSFNSIYNIVVDGATVTGDGVLRLPTKTLSEVNGGVYRGTYEDSLGYHVAISAPNLLSGTRWYLYNITDDEELVNEVVSDTAEYRIIFTGNKTIQLRASKLPYEFILSTGTLTNTGLTFNDSQFVDTIYVENDLEGSTVTEFEADFSNIEIEVSADSNETTVQRFYNWFKYLLTTEDGIANYIDYLSESEDSRNIVIGVTMTVENKKVTPLKITGGTVRTTDGSSWINETGGSIFVVPDRVYQAPTSGIAQAVLGAEVADYQEEGTFGKEINDLRKIAKNKAVTNPDTGKYIVYDDDNSVLYEADIYEDVGGTTAYRGQGLARRDKLE